MYMMETCIQVNNNRNDFWLNCSEIRIRQWLFSAPLQHLERLSFRQNSILTSKNIVLPCRTTSLWFSFTIHLLDTPPLSTVLPGRRFPLFRSCIAAMSCFDKFLFPLFANYMSPVNGYIFRMHRYFFFQISYVIAQVSNFCVREQLS